MAIKTIVTRGFGSGGSIALIVTRGYATQVATDIRRDRDAWYGKKKPLPEPLKWPFTSDPAPQPPLIDPETLWDTGWQRKPALAKRQQIEHKQLGPQKLSPQELQHYIRQKQEAEDEEIVIKAALEYLLN